MAKFTQLALAALGSAALLAGCATGPYDYGYGYGYDAPYYNSPFYNGPYYSDPYYYGPTVGFGYSYSDTDRRYRHENWRDRDHVRRDENGNVIGSALRVRNVSDRQRKRRPRRS